MCLSFIQKHVSVAFYFARSTTDPHQPPSRRGKRNLGFHRRHSEYTPAWDSNAFAAKPHYFNARQCVSTFSPVTPFWGQLLTGCNFFGSATSISDPGLQPSLDENPSGTVHRVLRVSQPSPPPRKGTMIGWSPRAGPEALVPPDLGGAAADAVQTLFPSGER